MSDLKQRITEVLEDYFDASRADGYIVDYVTGREAAERVLSALQPDTDTIAAAILEAINGVVPGASCDGDLLVTRSGVGVYLTGIADEASRAAVNAWMREQP